MNPPPNLDRLARLYRWMEFFSFGTSLSTCRSAFLGELGACRRALALGDGDGRFTARLLRANPHVEIDAVDASPAMLRALVRRAGDQASRVRVHCADIRTWQPPAPTYDLIVAHFFLDGLTTAEVQALALRLRDAASPAALWAVSEFVVPEGWFGRLVARPVVACLYLAFGLLTGLEVRRLPNHRGALAQAGFHLLRQRESLRGLLVSELWSLAPAAVDGPRANPATDRDRMLQPC